MVGNGGGMVGGGFKTTNLSKRTKVNEKYKLNINHSIRHSQYILLLAVLSKSINYDRWI